MTDLDKAHHIARQLATSGIDITADYHTWVELAASLASLGESGREPFHLLSSVHPRYNRRQCDQVFNSRLRRCGRYTIATLIHHARAHGIQCLRPKEFEPIEPKQVKTENHESHESHEPHEQHNTPLLPPSTPSPQHSATLNFHHTTLYRYVCRRFPKPDVERVFRAYGVGGTREPAEIVFWQYDATHTPRTGKIMRYLPDGHRDRTCPPRWTHPRGTCPEQVLFGLHLSAKNPASPVYIFESEKTALIFTLRYNPLLLPHHPIGLATGGIASLLPAKLKDLPATSAVTLCPDLDATQAWATRAETLREVCPSLSIMLLPQNDYTATHPKADLADLILSTSKNPPSSIVKTNELP